MALQKLNNGTDFVLYIDTDSLFVALNDWILMQLGDDYEDIWHEMDEDEKDAFILEIAKVIEKDVNDRSFYETQKIDYNSQVDKDDFRIVFKQEMIAKSGIFVKKKKYMYHSINEEGAKVDEVVLKGIEIVRSDSPLIVKENMKKLAINILKGYTDDQIIEEIERCRELFYNATPSEISENKSINNIEKYLVNNVPQKKCPYTVRGLSSLRTLIKDMGLESEHEDIVEGQKAKIVYLKENRYGISVLSYLDWVEAFQKELQIDYQKMIYNHFEKKLELILAPINKMYLLSKKKEDFLNQFLVDEDE